MKEPKIYNILGVDVKCLIWNLYCNEHIAVYETIEQFYDSSDLEGLCTDENSDIYSLHIYEETPVGFICITANTMDELIKELSDLS